MLGVLGLDDFLGLNGECGDREAPYHQLQSSVRGIGSSKVIITVENVEGFFSR